MFEGLQKDQLAGAIEAMLFVTDEPVGTIALADMLEVDPADVESALVGLRDKLEAENRGIQLREVAGGWRLYTHPAYHELIEKYVLSWDTRKLSHAAMETLAIVAYTQPTTRAQVASVRGVNSDSSINSLVEKGLVREAGTADTPGNPTLYATTRAFLEKFGLRSTADLPDLSEFAPDDSTRTLIRERLSAAHEASGTALERDEGDVLDRVVYDDEEGDLSGAVAGEALVGHTAPESLFSQDAGFHAAASRDEAGEDGDDEGFSGMDDGSAQEMLRQAMAQGFGVVDKIDFDELTFETEDE